MDQPQESQQHEDATNEQNRTNETQEEGGSTDVSNNPSATSSNISVLQESLGGLSGATALSSAISQGQWPGFIMQYFDFNKYYLLQLL